MRKVIDPYTRLMAGAIEGEIVRPELGPCLDFRTKLAGRYPMVGVGSRVDGSKTQVLGSRIVLERTLGRPIREGYHALHKCDRPRCIRDSHLYEGTDKDNATDRDIRTGNPFKDLDYKGEKHPEAKLNAESVKVIRFLVAKGRKQLDLARVYGVSKALISRIVLRQCWLHV